MADSEKIEKIIIEGNSEVLNLYAKELGERYAPQDKREKKSKLSASQIRNILDDVQRMSKEEVESGAVELLRPKLAYIAGKNKESWALQELQGILDKAIGLIKKDWERFKNFRNFFEAIVGYHRFYSKVEE